jgi:hypothetical protein
MTDHISETVTASYEAPRWTRATAQLVSYIFHPLFVPFMVAWVILYQHPIHVLLTDAPIRLRIIAMVFINTVLFPGIFVLLLWRLKFLPNLYMESQRARIIPLTVSILFYFWAYYVGRNLEAVPPAMQQWLLGVFLASCAAMFTNIFLKISLHTLAAGGAVMFFILRMKADIYWPMWWLAPIVFIAGLVGTARLLRKAHEPGEIYAGYLAGAICQVASLFIVS